MKPTGQRVTRKDSADSTSRYSPLLAEGEYFQLEGRGKNTQDVWYSMKDASGKTIEGFLFRWNDDATAASGVHAKPLNER